GSDLVGSSVTMVESFQQDRIVRTSGDLLLVFPSKNVHEVSFDRASCVNDSSLVAEGDLITTIFRPNRSVLAIPTSKWSPVGFRIREVTENQGPMISVEGAETGTLGGSVTVKNLTDTPVTRAVVIARAGLTDLFDLGPGETRRCDLRAPSPQMFFSWYYSQLSGSPDAQVIRHLV